MMQHAFSRFAQGGDPDFEYLQTQINRCAAEGHTYVFANCQMPDGCLPAVATVGFGKQDAGYLLYTQPTLQYSGENLALKRLCCEKQLVFEDFHALRSFLTDACALPRAQSLPSSVTPTPRVDTLTEADHVHFRRRDNTPKPPDYASLVHALSGAVLGQEQAVEATARGIYAHIHKKHPARPLSLIFHGPTGVGKSELGKQVAPALDALYGEHIWQFVWTELNTFTQAHSVYRLTGAPPGYVGYDDRPIFEAVCLNPRTVFMFDELEKAHPEVLKTFMSILDEGRCAARKELPKHGRELDFRQSIFLFTTNAVLSEAGRRPLGFGCASTPPATAATTASDRIFRSNERARKLMSENGCLREIAGRFSGFAEFMPLDERVQVRVIAKQIAALGAEYGLAICWIAPEIVQGVADQIGESFSVRSHTGIIEGCLTDFFSANADRFDAQPLRLEGALPAPQLIPA